MAVKIIECPRDAMQGLSYFIPTEDKVRYINQLLRVGFDTIDFGSFVSPKAVPQMQDTAKVIAGLDLSHTASKLLAIVANARGALDGAQYDEITYLGFPLSVSETFQKRNTNQTIEQGLKVLSDIQEICLKNQKTLVVYISMGFGNPYSDPYEPSIVEAFIEDLGKIDVKVISLADTIGAAKPDIIGDLFNAVIPKFSHIEFGAHFHSTPQKVGKKIMAAYHAGCRRFDGAIKGYGGCPFADDHLTGNLPTEELVARFLSKGEELSINEAELSKALLISGEIFR
jgi:hydroxymethylglutaryl-CoA lyase